jgi:hypothetical protein
MIDRVVADILLSKLDTVLTAKICAISWIAQGIKLSVSVMDSVLPCGEPASIFGRAHLHRQHGGCDVQVAERISPDI